jgi:uncharacterized NAD-dependent epimerase/dehydratase family protein
MIKRTAIVLTNGWLDKIQGKTAHGLLRGSDRFEILSLVDPVYFGRDAGEFLDGKPLNIPIYPTVEETIKNLSSKPAYCIVGVALHGGILPETLRNEIIQAMKNGLSIVSGLHSYLGDDQEFSQIAREFEVEIIDIRKPRPIKELRFWHGEIYRVKTPRIAMLGTDCAIGKRTTGKLVMEMCRRNGIKTEMIFTGQTGWMQGFKHGFIFDATLNDFIGGEIERVILECDLESSPELILIEGQASLQNPSGTCGSELLLSGNIKGVILQHAPGRKYFEGFEYLEKPLPSVEKEIELIQFYGAKTLAVTLHEEGMNDRKLQKYQSEMRRKLGLPVIRPLKEGVEKLLPTIKEYMAQLD